ncbi:MAG: MSMEG_0565 family glycosyltransferase [Thermosynechococcaceae cyanobacterium MS004]|nr:MSMEG_0565 family glycosyltransferase [Thermosynechococcaceae cyanobacterium MS004]
MTQKNTLRIAFLLYSTKPRGGVMHTIYLAEALQALGHQVCIFALAKAGAEFCRPLQCESRLIPSFPAADDVEALVKQRIQEFVDYFEQSSEGFDYYHAQDCISANALAILRDRQVIPHYLRTIHHIDDFNHPYLQECQDRSIRLPDLCLCVSEYWQTQVEQHYQVKTARVTNGVDVQRFLPNPEATAALKQQLGLKGHPIYLTVGGIEPRKNSIAIVEAFAQVLKYFPDAQLVIAGGDTFFDVSPYRELFFDAVQKLNISLGQSLIISGVVSAEELPVLYRCADAFVFPSLKEGWGLVVLEAIASNLPVITSNQPPFTEFLAADQALLVNPCDVDAIAQAMIASVQPNLSEPLKQKSQTVLTQYTWEASACLHIQRYKQLLQRHSVSEVHVV